MWWKVVVEGRRLERMKINLDRDRGKHSGFDFPRYKKAVHPNALGDVC
jgi:hypothetical protein